MRVMLMVTVRGWVQVSGLGIRIRFQGRGTVWKGFWLESGSESNVRMRARLRFRVTMRCG